MTDKTKKNLKIACAAGIAAGTIGFILLGGTEVAAGAIVAGAVVALSGITALIALIVGK